MTTTFARNRRSTRLRGYNYAHPGAYFITVCTCARECLLGEILGDAVRENALGVIVREEWERSAEIRREIELDAFVVMPNHVHGIVIIRDTAFADAVGATGRSPLLRPRHSRDETADHPRGSPPSSLSSFVAGWKAAATRRINALRATPAAPVWQRNYYEHIIRSDDELRRIQVYIEDNPRRWSEDEEHPDRWATSTRGAT